MPSRSAFARRVRRSASRLRSAVRERLGSPDPVADGPWARASLDRASGRLKVVLERPEDAGTPDEAGAPQVRLRHAAGSLVVPLVHSTDGAHRLEVLSVRRHGVATPLRPGAWRIEASSPTGWRPVLGREAAGGPVTVQAAGVRYRLVSTPSGLELRSAVRPSVDRRWTPVQRYRAARLPRSASRRPLERAVVYECFWGRQVGGNPLAMVEPIRERFPGIAAYWVVGPGQASAPEGTTAVVRWSAEWYTRLASAELVITNAALPNHFRRREGQTVLQTWHGTPLKRLGLDMLSFEHMSPGYAEGLRVQSAQWSALVAPSPLCSQVYPRAFAYDGPLLEVGSPRNDLLVAGTDPARTADIRRRLGVDDRRPIVLVAPTFRDGRHRDGDLAATGHLDLDSLCRSLGTDVTVLFRAHNWIDAASVPIDRPNLINVTDYPDIAELYLVTDVLVTDYSSVMFDFVVTGRPIVFHTPDLEHYRDELRGWYFDLEAEAPGPITRTESELTAAIADALDQGTPAALADRYRAFVERFTPWERGDAAQRVADALLDLTVRQGGTSTDGHAGR
ncbi:MAG: CDP-glycerol glycerophosphotransferase family protein [Microthrixaceae bacterium]|nr:CDP-glycerol glycerophosphotransferase family protein [Microthrixaceae bacterium]